MKIIGSVKEDPASEKRISITPETVKKLVNLNFSVFLEKKYGEHLGISDEEYKNEGASLENSAKEVLEKSEIILRVNCPTDGEINSMKNTTDSELSIWFAVQASDFPAYRAALLKNIPLFNDTDSADSTVTANKLKVNFNTMPYLSFLALRRLTISWPASSPALDNALRIASLPSMPPLRF